MQFCDFCGMCYHVKILLNCLNAVKLKGNIKENYDIVMLTYVNCIDLMIIIIFFGCHQLGFHFFLTLYLFSVFLFCFVLLFSVCTVKKFGSIVWCL